MIFACVTMILRIVVEVDQEPEAEKDQFGILRFSERRAVVFNTSTTIRFSLNVWIYSRQSDS